MALFAPNGLLGSSSLDKHMEPVPEGVPSFAPNGLLGPPSASASGPSSSSLAGPSKQFTPNGLLSDIQTDGPSSILAKDVGRTFTPNGLLLGSQDDDDDLPPVAEAFGIPPTLLARAEATATTTEYVPRFSVRTTTFNGKTMYLKRKSKVSHLNRNKVPLTRGFTERMGNLLDVPIHRLLEQLSVEAATKLQEADRQPAASTSDPEETIEDTLWVDRYRPRQFTDLMGNERVARETMEWVKQWDWCVFGKTKGKKRPRDDDGGFDAEDEYHRPREKLLLLSGPPGLGKTTLAHVVARQAGYEVMEINASDARSGSVIDDRIRPALESGSAVGSTKPVLLVIDEIDGATGAGENSNTFIHKLVQLTYDKPWKKSRAGKGRDPNAKRPILRPIICICNDQNAASLAKLRARALQIRFARPADIHTVKRLREVCEIEGLKADSRALTTLVGIARGDLRGCLNTLQFIKSRNQEVTEAVIRGATVGMKEAETSLVSVLNSLFTPLTRKRVKELAMTEVEESKYVGRLSREVDGCGRENSIAVGCFAHYATLHQHDANFSRYEKANEWLVTFDMLSAAMYSDGDFALSQYLPYTLVPFYPLFKERGGQRVERSQADWESLVRTRANEEIYKSLSRCLQTASTRRGGDFRHLVSTPILQLEFAPFLNRIISPPLRPVNSQVIKPEERALLARLVDIMSTLELQFFQERAEDGQLTYRLDPPIDVFVTYDGKRASDIAVSRYAVRHLVAGEIEAQLISRKVDIVERAKRGKHDFFGKSSATKNHSEQDTLSSPTKGPDGDLSDPPNKRARTEAAVVVDIADKPPTDFFGRLITVPSLSTTKAAERKNVEKKYRVTYRYKEGNSAAVRKPIKMNAFM
ncbi:P-loop containing nucleoside triphosphate hydrolase protein [Mycena latifolia]|nr:P-loop containing nucleoside triphosphate hydrolase protein [Mycena latifolia]